jgi:membrane protease YdiL (CAAX protease family)
MTTTASGATAPSVSAAAPPASTPVTSGLRPRLRARIAAHPVASAVLIMFGIGYPLMIPAALLGLPIEPFLLVTVLVGQLGGALVVTAATGGRAGVRELFGRVFRWRTGVGVWLLALLAIPVAALALASVVFGPGALRALSHEPAIVLGYLNALTILPLVNLWEETAWMGVIQHRLAERRGLLAGAALTAPMFALIHLPLNLGKAPADFAISMTVLALLAVPFRIVVGWLYQRAGRSILVVAVLHVTFNATNNGDLLRAAAPTHTALLSTAPWVVVTVWALGIVAAARRHPR